MTLVFVTPLATCLCFLFFFSVKLHYEKHFNALYEAARGARNSWYDLGIALEVNPATLQEIQTECRDNASRGYISMLSTWMKSGINCTLGVFLDALRRECVGCGYLCEEIEEKMKNCEGWKDQSTTNPIQIESVIPHNLGTTQKGLCMELAL